MLEEFVVTNKKRNSVQPFFQVYEARRKDETKNNYFVELYNTSETNNEKIKSSLQFNQAIFTDTFRLSTSNLIKIINIQKSEANSAHFVQKYEKTLQEYLKSCKKGRIPQDMCLMIMEDILKGLAAILEAGYRPTSVRADNVVRCFSRNPQQRPDIWKIKNVVYSSSFCFQKNNFLTYEQKYSAPQVLSRRNYRDHQFKESDEYRNGLLVWSLGIIFAKMLGVEGKLDSKTKLSEFKGREFNVLFNILYIRKQYSQEFLKMMSSMLNFDYEGRMKLKDLFYSPLFSPQLSKGLKQLPAPLEKINNVVEQKNESVIESVKESVNVQVMKLVKEQVVQVFCSLCPGFC